MNVHLLSFNPYISRINYQHKNKIAFERKKLFIKRCINKNLEKLSLLKVSFFDIQSKCGIRQEKYVYKSNENKHLIESSSKLNEKITFSTQVLFIEISYWYPSLSSQPDAKPELLSRITTT